MLQPEMEIRTFSPRDLHPRTRRGAGSAPEPWPLHSATCLGAGASSPTESRSVLDFLTTAAGSNFSDLPSLLILTFELNKSQEEKWLLRLSRIIKYPDTPRSVCRWEALPGRVHRVGAWKRSLHHRSS